MSNFFKIFFLFPFIFIAQNRVVVDGIIIDQFDEPVPYSAVGIIEKNIGVASNDEGRFHLAITRYGH